MALPALGFVKEAFFLSCFAKISCVQLSFLIKKLEFAGVSLRQINLVLGLRR